MTKHLVSEEGIRAEAERLAEALTEKWPTISASVTLETPSEADAYIMISAPAELEDDILWDAAELSWQALSKHGVDIVTLIAR